MLFFKKGNEKLALSGHTSYDLLARGAKDVKGAKDKKVIPEPFHKTSWRACRPWRPWREDRLRMPFLA